ncbi:MAG: tetratricopeptide repeat protein [Bryobacteraceae bacterium]|nr:tetratricopeptide repeat protein [Bryobacteraceae bacterium]
MKYRNRVLAGAAFCALMMCGCGETPEARRTRFLSKGKELVAKRDYQRALLELRNAAQAVPKEAADPYYQMGLVYAGMQDYRSAYEAFQKALSVNPNHAEARLKVAQMMAASEDDKIVRDANSKLEKLLAGGKPDVDTLNTLALTELRLGRIENAVQTLEKVIMQSPGELISTLTLARAKMIQGETKAAEDVLKQAAAAAPKSSELPRVLAGFYADQRRWTEAEEQLRKVLATDAANGPAMLDLARLLANQGRKPEAEQMFKKLSATESFRSIYAAFLYDENRSAEAAKELERLAGQYPDDRQIRTNLVVVYRALGRKDDARKVLERALKKFERDSDALLQRAEILIEEKQYAQAETDVNAVRKLRPTSPEVRYITAKLNRAKGSLLTYRQEMEEALRLNPALLPVRVELAESLIAGKEAKAALNVVNSAPQFQKAALPLLVQRNWAHWAMGEMAAMRQGIDAGLGESRTNDLLVQDAMWKLRSNNAAGARASLEEALKQDPGDLRALKALSNSFLAQKDRDLALKTVKAYAAMNPKSALMQEYLGAMLLQNMDLEGARRALDAAKAADPKFLQTDLTLAQVEVMQGKVDDARKRLESLAASDPSNVLAPLWLGNLETMKGNYPRAIAEYRKAVSSNPNDAQAANNLAYLLIEHAKETEEALKHAQRAVELSPDDPDYCDTLGWVLYRKGLYRSAIPYLERATANSRSVVSKYHLAMAYAMAGDRKRGESTLQAALKVNSRVPEAEAAQKVLSQAN